MMDSSELIARLTSKDAASACAFADQIVRESRESDCWYPYFDEALGLLNYKNSLVRNRATVILADNARWDQQASWTTRTESEMIYKQFLIDHIPAVLYGEPSRKVYIFVHGQWGYKEEGAAFAEIACPAGYQVLAIDLPGHGERKGEENRFNPWTAVPELQAVMKYMKSRWSEISLRTNSIGAHFSMLAFAGEDIHKALFVSPIVNMERLITDMMGWADISEQELREKGEIATNFGQTLSWCYLTWEREHPVQNWRCPTVILYAGQDDITSRETVEQFVSDHGAALTVMENGEHWFHTTEQLAVLQAWEMREVQQ